MQAFARSIQWLFTVVGLAIIALVGISVVFGGSGSSGVDLTCSATSGGPVTTCDGHLYGLENGVKALTVAVVGLGLLVIAAVMAITAGAAAPPRYGVGPQGPYGPNGPLNQPMPTPYAGGHPPYGAAPGAHAPYPGPTPPQ
ncbi:hypothetical protein [Cryptosporangium arvum]|jgi:hypothetical protein|uniref:hypothetical protein n=1 Tax=Cryptosporangium arvum TaxID=80871 RepID=UPI0004B0EE3C|nr:hypothetical protein [Cryptosporangium arvum]